MKTQCATSTCTIPVEFLFGSKVASLTCKRRSPISRWLCERPTCANQNEHRIDQQPPNESKSSAEPSKYAVGTNETIMKPYGSITLRGTNMRRGERKPASHLPLFSPNDFSPTDFSPIYFSPTDFSPESFTLFTQGLFTQKLFLHRLFTQRLFTHRFFTHILFTHRLSPIYFSPIYFSPTYFSPTYLGLYTFHPETLLPQAFQTFHPETFDQYTFFLPSDLFHSYTFHPGTFTNTCFAHKVLTHTLFTHRLCSDFSPIPVSPIYFWPTGVSPTDFSPTDFSPADFRPYTFRPQTFHPQTLVKGSLRAPESGSLRAPENDAFRAKLADTGLGHGVRHSNLIICLAVLQTQALHCSFMISYRCGVGWGRVITFMFLRTHTGTATSSSCLLSCRHRHCTVLSWSVTGGVGWGNNVHVPVHAQAQQPHHLSCCPADTGTALFCHDQLPVGWGGVG